MRAAERARTDIDRWVGIARRASELVRLAPGPFEIEVTGFDPAWDLARRTRRWGHELEDAGLVEIALFGAGLARTEAEAWDHDDPIVATSALEDRRFLFSDRVVHWVVPWADVAGRCHADLRDVAHALRDALLTMGDELRPAPLLTGDEGLHPPGEDSFGPLPAHFPLTLLGAGTVFFEATVASLTGGSSADTSVLDSPDEELRRDLATHFAVVAARWHALSAHHPGTARLWRDLARRAETSAAHLESE